MVITVPAPAVTEQRSRVASNGPVGSGLNTSLLFSRNKTLVGRVPRVSEQLFRPFHLGYARICPRKATGGGWTPALPPSSKSPNPGGEQSPSSTSPRGASSDVSSAGWGPRDQASAQQQGREGPQATTPSPFRSTPRRRPPSPTRGPPDTREVSVLRGRLSGSRGRRGGEARPLRTLPPRPL